jgi:hypothetical protein
MMAAFELALQDMSPDDVLAIGMSKLATESPAVSPVKQRPWPKDRVEDVLLMKWGELQFKKESDRWQPKATLGPNERTCDVSTMVGGRTIRVAVLANVTSDGFELVFAPSFRMANTEATTQPFKTLWPASDEDKDQSAMVMWKTFMVDLNKIT